MNVEHIGEKPFLDEIIRNQSVWVAMSEGRVYAQKNDVGKILFTWSSAEKAKDYIERSKMTELNPVEVPLDLFVKSWLAGGSMSIDEVAANPRFTSKILVLANEELQAKLAVKS